jgi:probable rRNA maturation factor
MIEILNRQRTIPIDRERFERLLRRLVRHYGLGRPELTLSFVDDPEIRELNRAYRKKDKPTDVLSFPLNETAADGNFYLGDIVISIPRAREQAAELGHSLVRELEILTVHGFLHLLGYDHGAGHEAEEAKVHALTLKAKG